MVAARSSKSTRRELAEEGTDDGFRRCARERHGNRVAYRVALLPAFTGWGWLLGLLLIPLLFGWLGLECGQTQDRHQRPEYQRDRPNVSLPALNFSPLSISA